MILTEQIIIKRTNPIYPQLDEVCQLSKNLYNATLYEINRYYVKTKKCIKKYDLVTQFIKSNQSDYRALASTSVATQTMFLADQNVRSFIQLLKLKKKGKYKKPVNFPSYLHSFRGRQVAIYPNITISKIALRKGKLRLTGLDFEIPIFKANITNVKSARIVPKNGYYIIEILYEVKELKLKRKNGRYAAIDLGVNNLVALVTNCGKKPLLISGRPLKSINQFYNKEVSKCKSAKDSLKNKNVYLRKLQRLELKRNCKIMDIMHKTSQQLIHHLVVTNINTLVIGYNQGWKQGVNIGKRNNQNFMSIPFYKFRQMLEYKARLAGINVIITNEAYTSKCSALDNEKICEHKTYEGKRINRGLFRSAKGLIVNADVNGALNILRHAVPKVRWMYGIEVYGTPVTDLKKNTLRKSVAEIF